MKFEDQEGFFGCIDGGFKCRSNNISAFLDLCEYKAPNLLLGLVDLTICCIFQFLVHFVRDIKVEGTLAPFETLECPLDILD